MNPVWNEIKVMTDSALSRIHSDVETEARQAKKELMDLTHKMENEKEKDSGSDSDMITITGKKPNVNKAVTEIQKIQNEMDNITSKDVNIPSKIHNTGGKAKAKTAWYEVNIILFAPFNLPIYIPFPNRTNLQFLFS